MEKGQVAACPFRFSLRMLEVRSAGPSASPASGKPPAGKAQQGAHRSLSHPIPYVYESVLGWSHIYS